MGLEHGYFVSFTEYFSRFEPIGVGTALHSLYEVLSHPGAAPEGSRLARMFLLLYLVLPFVMVVPSSFLMGLSFPLLQKVVQVDALALGRRVGSLQAANIGGSMLGALLVGQVSLNALGTSWTLKLLALLGAGFLLLGYRSLVGTSRLFARARYAAAFALVASTALAIPGTSSLWARLHGRDPQQVCVDEDETGVTLVAESNDSHWPVFTGGLGQSWLPYGGPHSWLGFLPAMLHPHPMRIAVIGLGSGDMVFFSGGRPETKSILCIEIVRSQLSTLRSVAMQRDLGGLRSILEDPRVRFEFADGRSVIRRRKEPYDIIEADALRPNGAFAGNLYSLEYFTMVRDNLERDGLAVTWAPTGRTIRTLLKVFPYVLVFDVENILIAIGSVEPIPWDPRVVRERLHAPFAREYFAREAIDLEDIAERVERLSPRSTFGPEYDRDRIIDFNSDLYPRDELLASRASAIRR